MLFLSHFVSYGNTLNGWSTHIVPIDVGDRNSDSSRQS